MSIQSRSATANTSARPSPGTPKARSTATEPPRSAPKAVPDTVRMGSMALTSAWRHTTIRSRSPLARAVRT